MKKRNIAAILFLPMLALLFARASKAASVTANSCSQSAVQSAVTSAGRNGTVVVPSGSCTWTTGVTITTGITLTGAGVGATTLTASGDVTFITVMPDATAISSSETVTISGFTFNGSNTTSMFINIEGADGDTASMPYRYYIIGNNKFENENPSSATTEGAAIQSQPDSNGQLRGVIYQNTFDRCNIILRLFSNDDTTEWSNTAFNQLSYGTEDNLYFEDNTIMFSSSYAGDNPGWIETGQGGRLVARYNTWNQANATTPQEIWDIHGFQNWTGTANSGQSSTMVVEYYGNTLTNMGTYRWVDMRGSWGLFFDNILTGPSGGDLELYGMSIPGSCPNQISPVPTNYNPLVNNAYFFNNTEAGSNLIATILASGKPTGCAFAENANFWNLNSSCTASACSAGIGEGTTPPTGTCTTGVGYWVASTPGATVSSSVIQNAALYKCTATNSWTKYYTPYTYPHPLRSSSQTSGPPSAASSLGTVVD